MTLGCIGLGNYKLYFFDKIPSTQTYAINMVNAGTAQDHIGIIAKKQTSGHGRFNRKWISKDGNLYVSFIFHLQNRDSRLSYRIAVAIAETMKKIGVCPQIKWPNDILIDKKKIAGILIEYLDNFVIVGIGINILYCPTLQEYATTKLDNYIKNISVTHLLRYLLPEIDKWLKMDFVHVKNKWTSFAVGINKEITFRNEQFNLIGINDDGALVLKKNSEFIHIYGDEIII